MPHRLPSETVGGTRASKRDVARGDAKPQPHLDFPVVAIGASAGGLEAATKLVAGLKPGTGMAFILIQHLDPTHESLLVDLLAEHTALPVLQAAEGMRVEPEHFYIIPPGRYLAIADGALRLTAPTARHGTRLPFDFLLRSLAEAYGGQAICVVLSGTGADGTEGARMIHDRGGFVIVQDPDEADYDGMPRSAMTTGVVDVVLPAAEIPAALDNQRGRATVATRRADPETENYLSAILDLLRNRTPHDFTLYKPGTMERRITRRMAMMALREYQMGLYLAKLRDDPEELNQLANDLLINVTSFFRDPKLFSLLADQIIPDLLSTLPADYQLRIWVAGCSTGEEAYSLAMLFREQLSAAPPGGPLSTVKLQVFASDADAAAVAIARDGMYPAAIANALTPERLARFFVKEDDRYRIVAELRTAVVFTVQDVLTDPPFSRLDLISCRNMLIYLGPAAQAKAIALFHFALKKQGVLVLGNTETIGAAIDHFDVVSKSEKIYRRIGRTGSRDFQPALLGDTLRVPTRSGRATAPSRQSILAGLCNQFILKMHAPATIISNAKHEYLYSVGPTDRFLRVAQGQPTQDLLSMVLPETRTRLRLAMQRAVSEKVLVAVPGGQIARDDNRVPFRIEVLPIVNDGEELLVVFFADEPKTLAHGKQAPALAAVSELEKELEITKVELQSAVQNLETSTQEQRAINEEALSVNEEFQSTNEELLTSKEELQSLNEELTALNTQLQETLEHQRTTSNDMQNILYSTDVATLFLDTDLRIRFFTPATQSVFKVIKGDIGRPLSDLHSLALDSRWPADARDVLASLVPVEREIEGANGAWFRRRILPYRAHDGGVEGVVITFNDITLRKQAAKALEIAKLEAELANTAKSRFLAAASHDLRQPLQTLTLIQGLLAVGVEGESNQRLVGRLNDTLGAMSAMLNTLLDIKQIEAGIVQADIKPFCIGDMFDRLKEEFTYIANAQDLVLHVVASSLIVESDQGLLEQIVRNLLSNAVKYTRVGKVLLGCRRSGDVLSVEVWDTGIGIPNEHLESIFDEYNQLDNVARERSRGLGLGLSIVRRLSNLLGHRVLARSRQGRGSVFTIEIKAPDKTSMLRRLPLGVSNISGVGERAHLTGNILVVEDDPELRDLLSQLLVHAGHHVEAVRDGIAALALAAKGAFRPGILLSDYNLPGDLDGLDIASRLRDELRSDIPVVILTGDMSTETLHSITARNCYYFSKPVRLAELLRTIDDLLASATPIAPQAAPPAKLGGRPATSVVFVVDDDSNIRQAMRAVLETDGWSVEDYPTCEAFLEAYGPGRGNCLLIDAYLPGMSGLDLLNRLQAAGDHLPAIMITGNSDVPMAVDAMRAGASDFIEKPITAAELLASVKRAIEQSKDVSERVLWRESAKTSLAELTARQREIMGMVLAGHPSKNIASDLGISQRTVENHRASIMRKTKSRSLPALARLALAAD